MRRIDNLVIHCTAGPQDQTVQVILDYWKHVMKWKTPGYHYLITPDGVPHNLVKIENVSNGVAGHNAHSIHISYVGGVEVIRSKNSKGVPINILGKPIDNRTVCQLETMEVLVRRFHREFPEADIKGHRDFSRDKNRDGIITPNEWTKACPSFSVAAWLKAINL